MNNVIKAWGGRVVRLVRSTLQYTTKEQTKKFSSANFQKMLGPSYIILRIQTLEGKRCRSG